MLLRAIFRPISSQSLTILWNYCFKLSQNFQHFMLYCSWTNSWINIRTIFLSRKISRLVLYFLQRFVPAFVSNIANKSFLRSIFCRFVRRHYPQLQLSSSETEITLKIIGKQSTYPVRNNNFILSYNYHCNYKLTLQSILLLLQTIAGLYFTVRHSVKSLRLPSFDLWIMDFHHLHICS